MPDPNHNETRISSWLTPILTYPTKMETVHSDIDVHMPMETVMSAEDKERIASLEANQQTLKDLVQEMRDDIREIKADFSRARGLVAGAVLAVSAIWGMAVGVWQFIKHKVS